MKKYKALQEIDGTPTIVEVDGTPTIVEVDGRAIDIDGIKCFWYRREEQYGHGYVIIEKTTGLAFSPSHLYRKDAIAEAKYNLAKYSLGQAITMAKRKYPQFSFPINK